MHGTAYLFLPELASGRGTAPRSGVVEGQTRNASVSHPGNHSIQIPEHIPSVDAKRHNAVRRKPRITSRIGNRPFLTPMPLAIHLNRQPRIAAEEIEDIVPTRMLPPKLQPLRPSPQHLPQQHLGQHHLPRQSARSPRGPVESRRRIVAKHRVCPSTTPLRGAVPLPETSSGRN